MAKTNTGPFAHPQNQIQVGTQVADPGHAVRHVELERRLSTRLHVRVHVPETGNEEPVLAVHHLGARRRSAAFCNAGDCPAPDGHRAVRNDPSIDDINDVYRGDHQLLRLSGARNRGQKSRGEGQQTGCGSTINHEAPRIFNDISGPR